MKLIVLNETDTSFLTQVSVKKQTNPNMRYGTYFQPATQLTGAKFAMGRAPLNSLQKMTEPGRREAEGRKLGCWCFAVLELPG